MVEIPKAEAPPTRVRGIRARLASARTAVRQVVERRRGGQRSDAEEMRVPEGPSVVDAVGASPTDLADADIRVRRAWTHARLAVLISVLAAQAILALIVWRIRVGRARRGGRPIPTL